MMTGANKASISVRLYIKWGDEPPSEPTSTLVLTSPRKYYVDTRLLMPSEASLPITTVEWAFAGSSSTTPATNEAPEHTIWTHWVDSTTPSAESVKDEGDMIVLDSGEVVERGQMVNPKTGKMENYEESWRDIRPLGENVGWVIQVQGQGTRGMVVRIGGFAQGVLRTGSAVGVRRWRYIGGEKGWDPIIAIDEFDMPADIFAEKGSEMVEGDTFLGSDGLEWVCVEKFVVDQ